MTHYNNPQLTTTLPELIATASQAVAGLDATAQAVQAVTAQIEAATARHASAVRECQECLNAALEGLDQFNADLVRSLQAATAALAGAFTPILGVPAPSVDPAEPGIDHDCPTDPDLPAAPEPPEPQPEAEEKPRTRSVVCCCDRYGCDLCCGRGLVEFVELNESLEDVFVAACSPVDLPEEAQADAGSPADGDGSTNKPKRRRRK